MKLKILLLFFLAFAGGETLHAQQGFPIMVDSLGRERLTTEPREVRIARMARQYGTGELVRKSGMIK